MKKYYVQIPISGYLEVEVDAENKESAIEKAFELATLDDLVEWEAVKIIAEGNIFRGIKNELDIIEGKE